MGSAVRATKRVEQAETDIAVLQVQVKNLHEKIDDIKIEIREVLDLIKQVQEENERGHAALAERINSFERIKWMLMGAAALIGATGVEAVKMFISHIS